MLWDLCDDLDELAPDALLLNYVNPMAINCWAVDAYSGRPHVGLCHSVQGTSEMLAGWIDVPYDEINFLCAGINHQAWFLEFCRGKEDVYPLIWEAIEREEVYNQEPVRIDLMKYFGYFVTESSGHASEYAPYFRKSAKMVEEELVPRFKDQRDHWFDFARTGGYLRHCQSRVKLSQAGLSRADRRQQADPDRAHARVRLGDHRGDGDERPGAHQRQCAESRPDHEPARRLLRRGAVPGRCQRHPADRDRRSARRNWPR